MKHVNQPFPSYLLTLLLTTLIAILHTLLSILTSTHQPIQLEISRRLISKLHFILNSTEHLFQHTIFFQKHSRATIENPHIKQIIDVIAVKMTI